MNPSYHPPTTDDDSDGTRVLSNPAKPILYVIGAFGLLQGVIGVPVGLFVGPHVLGAAIAMFTFGSTAVWLGHQQYDRFGRYGTITWGGLAMLMILAATWLQPPTTQDVAGIVFIALLLVVVGAVFIVAVWKRSGGIAS
ncbi:hypothetical protein SH501x_004327 [Pirellulaceae bacterium SH501]